VSYLWIKAFHLAAAMTWIGGMLLLSVVLMALASSGPGADRNMHLIRMARTWDARVTTPAMLIVWVLGLVMALQAGWFSAPWLWVKLVIVVILSAMHGIQSGTLRRLAGDPSRSPPAFLRLAAPAVVAAVVAIAILAITKPL